MRFPTKRAPSLPRKTASSSLRLALRRPRMSKRLLCRRHPRFTATSRTASVIHPTSHTASRLVSLHLPTTSLSMARAARTLRPRTVDAAKYDEEFCTFCPSFILFNQSIKQLNNQTTNLSIDRSIYLSTKQASQKTNEFTLLQILLAGAVIIVASSSFDLYFNVALGRKGF